MKKRPAAIFRLNAAEIARDLGLEDSVDRLGQVMTHQDIFGGDRRIGLELENEMAVGALKCQKRALC